MIIARATGPVFMLRSFRMQTTEGQVESTRPKWCYTARHVDIDHAHGYTTLPHHAVQFVEISMSELNDKIQELEGRLDELGRHL